MIHMFDMSAGLQITGWPAHDAAVSSVLFGPDETSIFSLGSDGKIFEWSLHNQGQILWLRDCSRFCYPESTKVSRHEVGLDFSGRRLLVTSGLVKSPIYQVQGRTSALRTLPHIAAITTVDWHPPLDDLSESPEQHYHDTSLETESDQSVGAEISDNHEVEQHVEETYNDKRGNVDDDDFGEASSTNVLEHIEDRHDPLTETKTTAETEPQEGSPDQVQEVSPDTEKVSREELGRLVASRWTGENTAEKKNEVDNNVKEDHNHNQDDTAHDDVQHEYNKGYTSEIEDNKYPADDEFNGSDDEYEDDHIDPTGSNNPDDFDENEDFSDLTVSTTPSWRDKVRQTFGKVIQAFNFFRTPVDISEGARIRKEYDESSSRLSKIQSRISSLTEKLKRDFGKDKEFYSFYGQCFENKENKYTYKVCPFKQATQVEGHSTTRLGNWDKFEESYRIMQFTYGDKCWNGPDRSLKVRLRCGLQNELTDVDEPSRCEYVALLSTPALCVEEKLKELQQKLERLNSSQPPNHDEL